MSDFDINNDTKKTLPKNRTLAVQTISCAVAVLIVFVLFKSGASLFDSIKSGYGGIMKEDFCADGVLSTARELFYLTFGKSASASKEENSAVSVIEYESATAEIDEKAQIETIPSSGGEDIKVLDALSDSTFKAVHISKEAVTPVHGVVTSPFGYRIHPVTGNKSFHTGLDIAAAEGSNIACAYDGTVLETGFTAGRGNYILIEHGDNLQTLYCHLSKIMVFEGTSLRAGETIGLVGSTGMSTGPHLHFELRVDGVRCNPVYALKNFADEV